jgi:LPS-assembly protein
MRRAQAPRKVCGIGRTIVALALRARLRTCAFALVASLVLTPAPASGQDPSVVTPTATTSASSFPSVPGGPLGGPIQPVDRTQPLYLQGDELIYDNKNNRVIARGNVEIHYNNYSLTADRVEYDQAAGTLTAIGNVFVREPNGNIVRAERQTLTDDFREGFIQQLSIVSKDETRIGGLRAIRREGNVIEFEQGKFTPCKNDPGKPPLWCISAGRVIHDQNAATITYQDAWFEVLGVPLVYMPYFQHPDPSVKRRSGFLLPEISSSTTLGFTVETPYYFALAPNYDFTFHPMVSARHGVLWQGDWRHKLRFGDVTGQYTVKLAAIDQDASTLPAGTVDSNRLDGWRGSLETKGLFSLSSWWRFGWDVTVESDDSFRRFYKLDNILQTDRVNSASLVGQSERNYLALTGYHFGGLLINDTANSESRVHPVVDWRYIVGQPVLGGELSWNVNALSFSRDLTFTDSARTLQEGDSGINRVAADIGWRRKLIDSIGQVFTPFANVRADVTHFKDTVDPETRLLIDEDTVSRAVASAGLLYSYPFAASTSLGTHTIEPIAQAIVRTASVDQRRLPDEDARSLVFDDSNLFELSKFSGWDRVETGTRLNAGVQYTFQAHKGGSIRVLAGQSHHLAGENPYLNPGRDADNKFIFSPSSGLETSSSDYVLGAYVAPTTLFRAITQARFDDSDLSLRRLDTLSEFNYGPISLLGLYSFTRFDPLLFAGTSNATDQQEVVGVVGLRLTDRWSLVGSIRYDVDEQFRLQDSLQLRYADECFVLTTTYTETFINNPAQNITPDRAVMLRFELKYLGEYRYKTDTFATIFAENQPAR